MRHSTSQPHTRIHNQDTKEHKEKAVVAEADAIPDPGTVVVETEDTEATVGAMHCTRRAEDVAGFAVFQGGQSAAHTGEEGVDTGV